MNESAKCNECNSDVIWDAKGVYCPKKCFDNRPNMVNHPSHYTAGGMEVIDILKAKLTPEQLEGFLLGNVIKYTTRYGHKNGVEDIEKALWYLKYLYFEKIKSPS